MQLVIHPDYLHLSKFIHNLPREFSNRGEVLYKVRNEVRLMEIDGVKVVVKKFKVPHPINRIAYSFFRKSKARRSFEYSYLLINKGFGAATPIAFSEYFGNGLITDSYYVSIFSPFVRNFNEFRGRGIDGRSRILLDFARFTAKMHEAGIRHLDYGGGNILFQDDEENTQFCLLDVNRMEIGKVGLKAGVENFKLLYMHEESFQFLIREYARIRGFNEEKCLRIIDKYIQHD
ncbi:MAG: lipopolysaccharide kinase InaA family protein [Bacteroidales bacterium]